MASNPKNTADAEFKKAQKAEEGAKAMAEYQAEAHATRQKTERLRALRLAKEAAEQRAAPVKKPAAKAKPGSAKSAAAKSGKAKSGSSKTKGLSEWLTSEEKSGRRG